MCSHLPHNGSLKLVFLPLVSLLTQRLAMDLSRELDKCDVIRDVLELRGADASFDLAKILVGRPQLSLPLDFAGPRHLS
jgi:hypothetical protein